MSGAESKASREGETLEGMVWEASWSWDRTRGPLERQTVKKKEFCRSTARPKLGGWTRGGLWGTGDSLLHLLSPKAVLCSQLASLQVC